MFKIIGVLFVIIWASVSHADQPAELTLSGKLSTSGIPARISAPVAQFTTLTALRERLQAGGGLILQDAELVIGAPTPGASSEFTVGVTTLKLVNSRIITNGNHLRIYCEALLMDEKSQIIAFPGESTASSAPGAPQGMNGQRGDDGGEVSLHLTTSLTGDLRINLSGQAGGVGAVGTKGAPGAQGPQGRNARNGDFGTCRRGPGRGGPGGPGDAGGRGGNGGDGGNGGHLLVTFINAPKPTEIPGEISVKGGSGGAPGKGGPGGDGGRGGRGGSNAGNCRPYENPDGANRGADGPMGPRGQDGQPGAKGRDGVLGIQQVTLS
jgi:hypothetical protein